MLNPCDHKISSQEKLSPKFSGIIGRPGFGEAVLDKVFDTAQLNLLMEFAALITYSSENEQSTWSLLKKTIINNFVLHDKAAKSTD